jgi:plastocyanin
LVGKTPIYGQDAQLFRPYCETDQVWHEHVQAKPSLGFGMKMFDRMVERTVRTGQQNSRQVLTIPVVVHIIHNNGPENIPDNQVFQGIQDLNDAFRNRGFYDPSQGVDVEIEFCLAVQDTFGNLTNGIERVVSPLTNMITPNDDIRLKNLSRWNPLNYLNIWIVNEITSANVGPGVVGYAVYPSSHGQPEDGIVCEAAFFGASQLRSTVQIHEAGHYLGLFHTFEGACRNNNCLLDGDRVCDTPPDGTTLSVPCNSGVNSCTTDSDDFSNNNPYRVAPFGLGDVPDPINNYMDYGDPTCHVAFTDGQKLRMRAALTGIRASLLTSPGCTSPCNTPITASFTSAPQNLTTGTTVNFTSTSTNATTFIWKIDDVVFSTAANPSFTFTQRGTYTIRLITGNASPNCIDSTESTLVVSCPFSASFTTSANQVLPGTTVNFTKK